MILNEKKFMNEGDKMMLKAVISKISYLTLLNEMNQFINDLKDYKVISSIVENFL